MIILLLHTLSKVGSGHSIVVGCADALDYKSEGNP
jgi:hypothetical protein